MPWGRRRKLCVSQEHLRSHGEALYQGDAMAEVLDSSPRPPIEAGEQRKPGAKSCNTVKWPQTALSTISQSAGVSSTGSSEGANCNMKSKPQSSKAPPPQVQSQRDWLTEMVSVAVQYLMQRYKMKQPIKEAESLKLVKKKYKNRSHEILLRASSKKEVVCGADLREVDGAKHSSTLVSKMDVPSNERVSDGSRAFPKYDLLIHILGMVFKNSNSATVQKIWEFLTKMTLYAGKRQFLFGESEKLMTQDFVKLKSPEHHQVPNSDPPPYEILWGRKAHNETSKMKVLAFWAKMNLTTTRDCVMRKRPSYSSSKNSHQRHGSE